MPASLFMGRAIKRTLRSPETMVATIGFPIVMVLTFTAAFTTSVEGFIDGPYINRLVPGLVVSGIMFGSSGAAGSALDDRMSGFSSRISSMPVPTLAAPIGIALAESVRAWLTVAGIVGVGLLLGFRFGGGPSGAAVFVGLAMLAAWGFSWIGLALASRASTPEELLPPMSALFLVLLFFSPTLVPIEGYPGWAQPFVRANPAGVFVSALDAAAQGEDMATKIGWCLAWVAGLFAVFGSITLRSARRT